MMNEMNKLVENFDRADIVLVGDIMLDRFIYGDVERISPEGPIPVLSVTRENEMLGGAGNVCANIKALGGKCDVIAVIGQDEAGEKIKALLGKNHELIEVSGRPTILKTRYIAQNQQLLRVDQELTTPISDVTQKEILKKVQNLIKKKNILILSDYGKGVLTDALVSDLIQMANKNNIKIIIDPKGKDFSKYKNATIITPNKKELSEATNNLPVSSDEEVESAAKNLIKKFNFETVVATRSEDGMSVIDSNKSKHIKTTAREVYDVSGAGDTVIATLATALGAGLTVNQAADLANITGGLVVAKIGTAVITQSELNKALNEEKNHETSFISPLLDIDAAKSQIQKWQASGLKVGFTNGCFDIVHYGHVNYLSQAREKCDRLVVGLNHDSSVKILKGPTRPINDQNARATVIASLASCDMVVFFGANDKKEDNTPSSLIGALKPDIVFKGGDYTVDQLPEAKIVLNYGGQVEIMPLYDGYSTTSIIEKSNQK